MLTHFSVSGFKSLDQFHLDLQKGLNVIIGPNGSGKTNIISFIEFLANISRHSLLDAVSRSGGAGRIFRRDDSGSLTKIISLKIAGEGDYRDFRSDEVAYVRYEYSAVISLSETNGTLRYANQTVRVAHGRNYDLLRAWPVEIVASAIDDDSIGLKSTIDSDIYLRDLSRSKSDPARAKAEMEELVKDSCHNSALFQLISRYIRGAPQIAMDLLGAKSLNISPKAVRKSEDIASEPEIGEDGSGLAAVLFALSNARNRGYMSHWAPFLYRDPNIEPEEIFEQIISYSRIVNDSIHRIFVEPDTIENQLRIFLSVNYGSRFVKLPFSLVSDGTAKWFTLVTAIVTSPSLFAIEEPENYLHPLMQKEIVRIVRESFSPDRKDGFAVMTTHSETILNCIDPDEMILVHMSEGRTIAKRPSNSDDIRNEINQTGFGAGYYYLAGAIE